MYKPVLGKPDNNIQPTQNPLILAASISPPLSSPTQHFDGLGVCLNGGCDALPVRCDGLELAEAQQGYITSPGAIDKV